MTSPKTNPRVAYSANPKMPSSAVARVDEPLVSATDPARAPEIAPVAPAASASLTRGRPTDDVRFHRDPSIIGHLVHLSRFGELLYMLTWRDIRVRYKQSVMGFLWAIFMPALVIGAGALVRVGVARFTGSTVTAHDLSSVIVRAVVWTFFVSSLRFGTASLLGNAGLVTKVSFPREVFPISAVLSSLFDFVIAASAMFVALGFLGWMPGLHLLTALGLFCGMFAFVTGLTLLLAATNLFFRDVKYLIEIILTYAIFFTPVLYEASFVGKWEHVVMLNPVAPVLEGMTRAIVDNAAPDPFWSTYSIVVSMLTLLFGYWTFKRLEAGFAESI